MCSTMRNSLAVGLVLLIAKISAAYYNSDADLQGLQREVEKLSDRVDILTNELERDSDQASSCIQYEDIPSVLPDNYPDILPLEGHKEPVGMPGSEGVKISLKYWSKPGHVIPVWRRTDNYDKIDEVMSNSVPRFPPGVSETQIIVPSGFEFNVMVNLFIGNKPGGLRLDFNISADSPEPQTCIGLPVFNREPEGDIVYHPGHDVLLKLTVPPAHDPSQSSHEFYHQNIRAETFLVDLKTGEFIVADARDHFDDGMLEDMGQKKFLHSVEISTLLKMSEHPVSGLVQFSVSDGPREGDLIYKVERQVFVPIRPSTQRGPFPARYLSYVPLPIFGTDVSDDGSHVVGCDRNSPAFWCSVGCVVAGTDLTSLTMWKGKNGTTRERVTNFEIEYLESDTMKSLWFRVPLQAENANFICEASNAAGVIKYRSISVVFYSGSAIDSNRSSIIRLNDTAVLLTCVATGNPQPNVTFSLNYDQPQIPDEIIYMGDEVIAKKIVPFAEQSDNYYGQNELYSAECNANQQYGPAEYAYSHNSIYFDLTNVTAMT